MEHAAKNPNHCTLTEVREQSDLIYGKYTGNVQNMGYEISAQAADRALYGSLGIEFCLTPLEMEIVFWNAASMGAIMPGADEMLGFISKQGIRSAVISNIPWSGAALTERLDRLLPNNRFEFVLASSDYFLRKPNRLLFETALQKAGLSAGEAWYCGDNPQADIEGAAQAGLYPVWYDNDTEKNYKDRSGERPPQCEHLHIREWSEMTGLLRKLK